MPVSYDIEVEDVPANGTIGAVAAGAAVNWVAIGAGLYLFSAICVIDAFIVFFA